MIRSVVGSKDIQIELGGIAVSLVMEDGLFAEHIRGRYADFLTDGQRAAITIHVRVVEGAQFLPVTPGTWEIRTAVRGGRLQFESYFESGWVDFDEGHGQLIMGTRGTVENFLRALYAHLVVGQEGLLVHAAGVMREGRAYVFLGPSGSGKTTIARLSSEAVILSDDMVIMKKTETSVCAYGVPFRGDLPEAPRSNVVADVAGIFCLRKGTVHSLKSLPMAQALAELVACVPFVMGTPAMGERVAAIGEQIVRCVPVKELTFRQDAGFWPLVAPMGRASQMPVQE